jgi:hypothetical protein
MAKLTFARSKPVRIILGTLEDLVLILNRVVSQEAKDEVLCWGMKVH